MKKLVIAAVAAAMIGGAYAGCGEGPIPENCAMVYNFKASLKTTADKYGKVRIDLDCGEKETVKACFRDSGKKTLNGYYYACDCDCDLSNTDQFGLMVWDSKTKVIDCDATIEWSILNLFGKNLNKVEALFNIALANGEFTAAGMGTYDLKNAFVKSISGNIVGYFDLDEACLDCCDEDLRFGDACDFAAFDDSVTVAYGSWSLKYNKSLSKKLTTTDKWGILPKGVVDPCQD